jgi:hypothetical protein
VSTLVNGHNYMTEPNQCHQWWQMWQELFDRKRQKELSCVTNEKKEWQKLSSHVNDCEQWWKLFCLANDYRQVTKPEHCPMKYWEWWH